eukprot:1421262-Rhodomonas_salina.2
MRSVLDAPAPHVDPGHHAVPGCLEPQPHFLGGRVACGRPLASEIWKCSPRHTRHTSTIAAPCGPPPPPRFA